MLVANKRRRADGRRLRRRLPRPVVAPRATAARGVDLAGRAAASDISIAGSGDIDGRQLTTDRADVSIAGSGGVKLRSDGTVEASIMGSGDVDVTGSATCKTSAMGSGKVRCGR